MIKTINPSKLKEVAGGFATGVTVVCVEDDQGEVIGMTANSFVSVSLLPPLVMFSVRNEAGIMNYLEKGKNVGISILSEDQKWLSERFAGINHLDAPVTYLSRNRCHTIQGSLGWYETIITQIVPAGDHQLILCEVDNLGRNDNSRPLIYYTGYNSIGDII